ncbi:Rv3235 family protein [Corynebacterium macclintockiae]|uniref:Rv3235 family protein n=1 Tax=Corynebacterium macclintockiae TaxID=2913501 RepID=UPI003EBC25BE
MTTSTPNRPLTDFVFLRPPTPAVAVKEPSEVVADSFLDAHTPPPQRIAQMVKLWLEALEGRRPIENLRRAPFSERVLEQLRVRRSARPVQVGASIISLHIQPSASDCVRFCASVQMGDRVRALAGTMSQHTQKRRAGLHQIRSSARRGIKIWAIDSLSLI